MKAGEKRIGRTVGALLLLHLGVGLTLPFVLLDRVRGASGYLENAAASPGQVRAAVFLLFAGSVIPIGVSIMALPVFRRDSAAMALWLFAIAVTGFSLQAVDNGALLSMLSLSEEYARAEVVRAGLFPALDLVVSSARRWAHFTSLLVAGSWILLLCALLYRSRLVPRALAGFGVVGSILQITGVPLLGLLGYAPETRLAMPLAPAYLALAVWLMVKGFEERQSSRRLAERGTLE